MHITLIILGALSGICIYVAVNHAFDAKLAQQDRHITLFAFFSSLIGLFGLILAMRYQLTSATEVVNVIKWELSLITIIFLVFPWFVQMTSGIGSHGLILGSNILLGIALLDNLISPYSIQFTALPTIQTINLPWKESICLPHGEVSLAFKLCSLLILLLQVYAVYAFARMYFRTRSPFPLAMFAAVLLTFFSSIQGILVRVSTIETIHLGSFGLLSMVIVMSTALNRENVRQKARLQHDLNRTQELQTAIFNYAGYAIISGTPEGIITSFNPAAERMLGYSAEEMIGKQTPNMYHDPEEVKARATQFSAELGEPIKPGFEVFVAKARRGLPNEHEWTYIRKDGTRFPVLLTVTALRSGAGAINGFLGVAIDISERIQALKALRESEAKYRQLFENMTTAFALHEIMCDENGKPYNYRYLEINPAFEKQTGVPPSALLGKTILDVMPNTEKYWIEVFGKVALTGEPIAYENFSRELGRYYDTWVFSPRKNQFAVIFSDSTERIKALEALRTSETQLRSTLDNTPGVAVQWFDRDGNIMYWNRASETLFAIPSADANGKPIQELLHTEDDPHAFSNNIHKIEQDKAALGPLEMSLRSINGIERIVQYTMFMIPGAGEQPIFVCMAIDITEHKHAEVELKQHREHLEEIVEQRTQAVATANKELEAFSYSVSHDLRAPLRSIDGFSQILAEDYSDILDSSALGYLHRIRQSSQRMAKLIDDLLELARVGRTALHPVDIDLSAMVNEIIAQLRINYSDNEFTCSVEPNLHIRGDAQLLHVVLTNLLDNALKYTLKTDNAHIEFGHTVKNNEPIYYVRDNGAGFDMQYVNKLFGAFQRLHKADDFPGTGIGLATVQRIIHRHHGSVWAYAEPDIGATFYFTLGTPSSQKSRNTKQEQHA